MSSWNDVISTYGGGELSYSFPASTIATLRLYAKLGGGDYTGSIILRVSDGSSHHLQLEGSSTDTLKIVEYPGESVIIDDIPAYKMDWQQLVIVITAVEIKVYQNGTLTGGGYIASPLSFTQLLFYSDQAQLYDELTHIPVEVSEAQIERWGLQDWPVITADPGGYYEEQFALGTIEEPTGEWLSNPPETNVTEYLWMRRRWVAGDGTPGSWSTPVRIKGDQGPAGEVGQLGLYADGTTLYLKAYAHDGSLTADSGYLYVGTERITVTAYSETLTEEGLGYVALIGATVAFVKMVPNDDAIQWVPYEGGSPVNVSYVIGRFAKNGSTIYDMEIIPPTRPNTFTNERFMELLAERDEDTIEEWAKALGVEKVFKKIAVLEAFVDQLKVNYAESGLYQEDASGNPIFGFLLDGYSNLVKIAEALITRATIQDTIVRGRITINANDSADQTDLDDANAVLKTSFGASGIDLGSVVPSRWRGADVCDAISRGAEGSVTFDSVAYDYFRCSSTSQLELITIGTYGGGGGSTTGDVTYTIQHPGQYRVWLNGAGGVFVGISSWVKVYKNGVVILYTETFQNSSHYFTFDTNDVIRIETQTHNAYLYLDEDGLVLTDDDYVSLIFIPNDDTTFSERLIVSDPAWDSNDHIVMGTVTTWASNITTLDTYLPCDLSVSNFTYNGTAYKAAYVMKTSTAIQIITASGPLFTFFTTVDTGSPGVSGWYRLAGDIETVAEQRGLITDHLFPNTANAKNIGAANNRYGSIFGNTGNFGNMHSTVITNDEDENNEVWGAVFN